MKKGFAGGAAVLIVGLFISCVPPARGDADIYWDFDNGFFPNAVAISPGETVTWWNVDVFGFDVRITFDNGFSFSLPNLYGQGITFPSAGIYGFHSDFGDNGVVTVSLPAPPEITLDSPRLVGNQFLFDATGLTVGKTNLLQTSTNLTAWTSVSTNISTDTSITFTNVANLPQLFFRLIELP